ncbi:MAG TPA: Maf family protein [Elusimicrobiota bacterium]|nr:Maf family protein [Elusimicrobiota bacterium]
MDRRVARPLILASASPRRRQLLRGLGIPFRVIPSHVGEEFSGRAPKAIVQELALRKARAIAKTHPDAIVLGADTIVVLNGEIINKPLDKHDAYRMLYRLSGSTHRVLTGVAVVCEALRVERVGAAVSSVRMRKMQIDELIRYSRKHMDKAGAYAIQEKSDPVATVISGSYDNVVGLPVDLVGKMLREFERRLSRTADIPKGGEPKRRR